MTYLPKAKLDEPKPQKRERLARVEYVAVRVRNPADLAVVLIRPHRPRPLIVTRGKGAVGLGWIAVDERPQEHRVRGAAHLMLDGEEVFAACKIDDVAKAVLIGVVFAEDEI